MLTTATLLLSLHARNDTIRSLHPHLVPCSLYVGAGVVGYVYLQRAAGADHDDIVLVLVHCCNNDPPQKKRNRFRIDVASGTWVPTRIYRRTSTWARVCSSVRRHILHAGERVDVANRARRGREAWDRSLSFDGCMLHRGAESRCRVLPAHIVSLRSY